MASVTVRLPCATSAPAASASEPNGAISRLRALTSSAPSALLPRPPLTLRAKPAQQKTKSRVCAARPVITASAASAPEYLEALLDAPPAVARQEVTAFAPATVANLGPGFDFLGCAVEGLGDHVTARILDVPAPPSGNIIIESIEGDNGRLGFDPTTNCIGIAARATMELLGLYGLDGKGGSSGSGSNLPVIGLTLNKGLPLGSGLGSSAASAAAAAVAVNALFGSPLSKAQLVLAGLQSEAAVSGYHADNVAPALMGGFVLVRSYRPLHLIPLAFGEGKKLFFVVVTPAFEAPTKEMRAALPKEITMASHVANSSQAAALIHAIHTGDARLLGAALASDTIVEPRRSPLIPGMSAVKVAAKAAGAHGCTISGAGPTAVAVVDSEEVGRAVGAAMVEAFQEQGKLHAKATVAALDSVGGRVV
ncbi:unnamed protein product [Closterium sp. NIES-64]|nr:unnamed protein product [Closterium sp. NIES-65]CAI5965838.1 unnamed protein product [Closterium sp. NIES-64]CAI5979723.1 unnamed protein product [Closterium sp. NIES-64]CAI5981246.1 unnamed protein product [Closterium sp. NIES-65]CAI6011185.1 unnamed protein product [Closterium sp. NIES-65]